MAVALSPIGGAGAQFFNNNGVPLSGGKLYTYEAGTTTPATTYTSLSGTVAHTNPIILDSAGRVPGGEIWLTLPDSYKFVLKTSSDVLLGTWDNIQGYSSGSVAYAATEVQTATANQTLFVLTEMFYNPGTNTLAVYVDGVNQVVNNSYVESTSTSVTFMAGLHVGALVKFVNVNVASADASAVTYEPGFTGSVATTVEAKLQQTISAEDFGAVGNGVATDTTAVANMVSDARLMVSPSNSEYLIGPVNLPAEKTFVGISFLGAASNAETLRTSTGAANVKLIGVDLDAAAGIGLHMNTNNCADVLVVGSNLKTMGSYGVLVNTAATGTDGVVLIGSAISSDIGDAVELNTNLTDSYNYSTIGCLLTGGPNGTGTSSGFGIGIAGTDGHITIGNHIKSARNEAIHIEDSQRRGVVGFNTARACAGEGLRVLFKTAAEGVVISGNSLTHTGTKTGIAGYRIVNDANGHLTYNYLAGNVANGFGSGYRQEGVGVQVTGDNIAVDCDLALEIQSAGIWLGTTYAKSCTALASGGTRAIIGKIVSDTNVLIPLSRTGTAAAGAMLKGLNMPFAVSHTGGGTAQQFNIVTLPNRMAGRATVIAGSGTQSLFYSAEVHWDGTTLTLSNALTQNTGSPTTVSLINNAGALALQFTSATVQTYTASFDFDGIWYKQV